MAIAFTELSIGVECGDPDRTVVQAQVCGMLGYHATVWSRGAAGPGVTVTHIPTGRALATALPTYRDAVRFIEGCLATPIDWAQTDLGYYTNLKRTHAKEHKAILALAHALHGRLFLENEAP